ncbi:cysteate synthase [Amycolatopsis sp. NPDC059657]|uniref:cysteate synthase n=1 Tax=Amycolatopsis sp. NPDC059657 TaxID=3346899 RepID=UPI0036727381
MRAAAERPYTLVCRVCGGRYEDDGLVLSCQASHADALLATEYPARVRVDEHVMGGLFQYRNWLPVRRVVAGAGAPVVLPGGALGTRLGLTDLWISFSGYWPEIGANLRTGTFKELEAYTVLGRLPDQPPVLVVASAGNTAAAFAMACGQNGVRCVLVVPGSALDKLRLPMEWAECVSLVVLDGGCYRDAIEFASALAALPGFHAEGGFRNVARRDGLGTVMLAAYDAMGGLPDYYFQAVGSGAGAIGAYENALRLGKHEDAGPPPRIVMCQNLPYAPIHRAWTGLRSSGADRDLIAPELANATPPYAIAGGVRECLTASGGDVLAAGNAETLDAMRLFEATLGIDIEPSAGVALAALRTAADSGMVPGDAKILLNVTGGGRARSARDLTLVPAERMVRLPVPRRREFPGTDEVQRVLTAMERGAEHAVAR